MRSHEMIDGFDYNKLPYVDYVQGLYDTGCTIHNLGESSYPEHDVYGLSIGKLDNKKPIIFIEGQIHGLHEWRTAYWVREFMRLLANPPSDKYYGKLLKELVYHFDFYCVPLLNPYGYINNTYGNANGVSISRNFDYNWDTSPIGEGTAQYKGTSAWSEPESQIVRDIITTHKPFTLICCHTWGGFNGFTFRPAPNGDYRHTFVEITNQLNMLLGLNQEHIGVISGVIPEPTAYNWAKTLNSDGEKQTYSCGFETGSLETEFEQSRMGLNGLLFLCLGALNNYKKNTLSTTK